ncbi:MAG: peptidase M28, partial [Solirubrobacterales bacterium]|nr:peptidase M28 [Solirubrobacterales bacterium]
MPATPDPHRTDDAVHHLARIRRAAGSPGEHEAARWIADRLRDLGADARVEEECVHGTYWWPLGLLNAVGVGAALLSRGRRWPGALLALAATAGLGDDLDHRSRAFRRMALPRRVTCNVVAHVGDRAAARTALVVVHHDAAHGGAVFDPRPIHLFARLAPRRHARSTRWPPLLWTVIGGPLLVALGAATGWPGVRDAGALLAAGAVGFMVDIGRRAAVPGANDNASGVAAMLRVAEALRD